ncbi:hypothetical protein [Sphingobacterium bovistauri]|uniref:Uncharacterized protein n=1 Tax=Sphingobacterium bovistauri TaxID=2781959 RepID=A0ABS7Z4U2_9SPHI|nr:hypothetical protein [Sphingobacterium bovistauri]MCA5005028.1 hypothetical protein [Sphingobacterium bovistauri]
MKRILPLLTTILFNLCYAQNDSTKIVNLISYLSKGETLNYSVLKTRIDSNVNKEPITKEEAFNFKITVKDSTDSNYIISYYRALDVFATPQLSNLEENLQQKLIELSTIKFDYETNELGAFKRIIDEDELTEKISSDFEGLLNILSAETNDEKTIEFMKEFIGSIDPKSLITVYAQDIHALHYALGASLNLRDTIEFEEEIFAPILNAPITMIGIVYCDEYDQENDFISIIQEKRVEGDFMEKMLDFVKKHKNTEESINEEEFKNTPTNIYFHNTYQYNSVYGVATYIELFKEITVEGKNENLKRIDIYEISLVEE